MSKVEGILKELNIKLPNPVTPAANYLPYNVSGNHVYISGQLPIKDGEVVYTGKLGKDVSVEQGRSAAELCAINIIAVLKKACDGDLEKVKKCVKLGIFINGTTDFYQSPQVGNGASDFLVKVFGQKGKHARFAIGVASLPRNAAVEIDAIFELC
jgi:enamine deaminase RidA (YjgF/YER057c/UK114 family)